ncbi:MAG: diguanylate cyclase domain-containing protein, partial [Desulfonatronovibrio sp.]
GFVLEQDVTARNGRFLIPRGAELTSLHIDVLRTWGVDKVEVSNGYFAGQSVPDTENTARPGLVDHVDTLSSDITVSEVDPDSNLTSMARKLPPKPATDDPEGKIHYLQKMYEFSLFALEQAASLGDFHASLTRKDDAYRVLKETSARVSGLAHFDKSGYFIMNEDTSSFDLALCVPEDSFQIFEDLLSDLLRSGYIAEMIWKQRPIIVSLKNSSQRCIVHLVSTISRVRGLFMGFLREKDYSLPPEAMSLLSNVLQNTANALESSQLYSIVTRHNIELQAKVEEKTAELKKTIDNLENEIVQRKTAQDNLAFIFNNVHDAIFVYDSHGKITDVNDKMMSMFGITRQEAMAMTVPHDISCRRRTEDAYFEAWNEVLEKGKKIFEWTVQSYADGHIFPVEVFLRKITWNDQPGVLATLRDISQRKEAQKQLEFLAMHDPLTGLPNRKLFIERLNQAIISSRRGAVRAAVLFIDLDGFKPVNDDYGHHAGDHALKTIAARLADSLRKSDTVARLGGDEFGVVISDIYQSEDHLRVAAKISRAVRRPITLGEYTIEIDCSIGTSVFPEDGQDVDTLIKVADTDMYKVKRGKKGGVS